MKRSTMFGLGCVGLGMLLLVPFLLFIGIWQFLAPDPAPVTQVAFSDFIVLVRADPERDPHVDTVVFKGREIDFVVKDPAKRTKAKRRTFGPADTTEVTRELTERAIPFTFEQPEGPPIFTALLGLVVLGILGGGVIVYLGFELSSTRKDLAAAITEARRLQALLDNAASGGPESPPEHSAS